MGLCKYLSILACLSVLLYVRTGFLDNGVKILHKRVYKVHSSHTNKVNGPELKTIYFAHIPKTGGTTIGNILNRVILLKNLTFPMFSGLFPWPSSDPLKTVVNLMQLDSERKFDILHRHTMYNKSALHILFEKDKLVKVTMLRQPLHLLKSLFNFADLASFFNIAETTTDPVQIFLQNISLYDRPHLARSSDEMTFSWTRDFASSFFIREFNLSYHFRGSSQNRARDMVDFLEQELDLVMIQDYFDESLLFLQELAGLSLSDMVYLDVRKSLYAYKHRHYKDRLVTNFHQWSNIDFHLYTHFKQKLEERIRNAGIQFQKKLEHFRKINHTVRLFCNEILNMLFKLKRTVISKSEFAKQISHRFYKFDQSSFSESFIFNGTECVTLSIDPNILELAIFCQKIAKKNHTRCQGRNRIFTEHSDLKFSDIIPMELFKRRSGFGWPLLWGPVPVV